MGLVLRNDHDPLSPWRLPESEQRCLIAEASSCYILTQLPLTTGPELIAAGHCQCVDGPCTSISDLYCRTSTMGVSGLMRACEGIAANGAGEDRALATQIACMCTACGLSYPGCVWAAGGDLAVCESESSCVDGFTDDLWTSVWPPECWGAPHYGLMGLVGMSLVLGAVVRFWRG